MKFKTLDQKVESHRGGHKVGSYQTFPATLVEAFGWPLNSSLCNKVSGQYLFIGEDDTVFSLYDWKATSLYLEEDDWALTPDEFWNSKREESFSIGGRTDPVEFIAWLDSVVDDLTFVYEGGGLVF